MSMVSWSIDARNDFTREKEYFAIFSTYYNVLVYKSIQK